jgi:hypothetical protein
VENILGRILEVEILAGFCLQGDGCMVE